VSAQHTHQYFGDAARLYGSTTTTTLVNRFYERGAQSTRESRRQAGQHGKFNLFTSVTSQKVNESGVAASWLPQDLFLISRVHKSTETYSEETANHIDGHAVFICVVSVRLATCFHAGVLLGLFDPEYRDDMLLRRQYSSQPPLSEPLMLHNTRI
jgi:hypothetical protein